VRKRAKSEEEGARGRRGRRLSLLTEMWPPTRNMPPVGDLGAKKAKKESPRAAASW
jgi:hypothetical protein